jgi:hypothetical protein
VVAASGEEFGDTQHAVGDTVDVGGEGFGNDRDPHGYTVRYQQIATSQPP